MLSRNVTPWIGAGLLREREELNRSKTGNSAHRKNSALTVHSHTLAPSPNHGDLQRVSVLLAHLQKLPRRDNPHTLICGIGGNAFCFQ